MELKDFREERVVNILQKNKTKKVRLDLKEMRRTREKKS